MTGQGDTPRRLSVWPGEIGLEHYATPDILDMMVWGHVFAQRDELIVRAWKHGTEKAKIARIMGVGRTTVWRVIERHLAGNPECPHVSLDTPPTEA